MLNPHVTKASNLRAHLTHCAIALLLAASASTAQAQETLVYSIADDVKAENDCSDPANVECKKVFENTCNWVGDSAVIMREGHSKDIPQDRVVGKVLDNFVKIGDDTEGYVDIDLANILLDEVNMYFMMGQYELDFARSNDQMGMAFALMLGAEANGDAEEGFLDEGMAEINKNRDEALRQKWFNVCMQTAYF